MALDEIPTIYWPDLKGVLSIRWVALADLKEIPSIHTWVGWLGNWLPGRPAPPAAAPQPLGRFMWSARDR